MTSNFHKKNFALRLALKRRQAWTRRWPILPIPASFCICCFVKTFLQCSSSYFFVLLDLVASFQSLNLAKFCDKAPKIFEEFWAMPQSFLYSYANFFLSLHLLTPKACPWSLQTSSMDKYWSLPLILQTNPVQHVEKNTFQKPRLNTYILIFQE